MEASTAMESPAMALPRAGYRDGARAAAPLALVVGIFGVSWGVLAGDAGIGPFAALLMSATTFAGSAQFAAISILADGGGIAAAVTAAVLLNARYGPIGLSIAPVLRGNAAMRLLQSQLVVDESWAVANRGGGRFDHHLLIGAGAAIYISWLAGTALGALGGDLLGEPETLGLDAAFPALFVALLAPQLRDRRALAVACAGAAIALALVPLARPGVPVIAAATACAWGFRRP